MHNSIATSGYSFFYGWARFTEAGYFAMEKWRTRAVSLRPE